MAQYWKSPHSSCLDSQQWQGRLVWPFICTAHGRRCTYVESLWWLLISCSRYLNEILSVAIMSRIPLLRSRFEARY